MSYQLMGRVPCVGIDQALRVFVRRTHRRWRPLLQPCR